MGYVLCGHRGSGDHGCEDWVRGLCKLLPEKPDVYSQAPEEDWRYGIGKLGGIFHSQCGLLERQLQPGDLCVDAAPRDRAFSRKKQVYRVLWGWSPGKLTSGLVRQLRCYDAVVVTEKRGFQRLEQVGLEDKLYLRQDPAFLVSPALRASAIPLPRDTVGLCLSYPQGDGGILYESYCHLLRWILKETDFSVALIPYCVQRDKNDLPLQTVLYRQFRESGRVFLRKDGDSQLLRGDLSMCRCCVGFAGAVAAWSCGVPALCLSGGERVMGLSRDIWGSGYEGVCPWLRLSEEWELTERFQQLLQRENGHRRQLQEYLAKIRDYPSVTVG